jgi:uncharacterized membrane protein YccC
MPEVRSRIPNRPDQRAFVHSARTAIAAMISLLVARAFGLPEAYWATITTLIIMQSTLGAALTVSEQRLGGTALGAAAGALLAAYFGSNIMVFGVGVFLIGLTCFALRLEEAYRLASVTLAIVMLIARTQRAWMVATHRFVEVSVGIAVGLALTAVWPEGEPVASPAPPRSPSKQGFHQLLRGCGCLGMLALDILEPCGFAAQRA